jgi:CrcB protein
MKWQQTVLIFAGGGLGALLRGYISVQFAFSTSILSPATLLINAVGSLLIGFLWGFPLSTEIKSLLVIGLLGGFTTFSGFSIEFLQYMQHKSWSLGFLYVFFTVASSLFMVWVGNRLHSLLF